MSTKRTREYVEYHAKVVEACVRLMGEQSREFWDKQCSYDEEFLEQQDPEEVAHNQMDSL